MKKKLIGVILVLTALALFGCGEDEKGYPYPEGGELLTVPMGVVKDGEGITAVHLQLPSEYSSWGKGYCLNEETEEPEFTVPIGVLSKNIDSGILEEGIAYELTVKSKALPKDVDYNAKFRVEYLEDEAAYDKMLSVIAEDRKMSGDMLLQSYDFEKDGWQIFADEIDYGKWDNAVLIDMLSKDALIRIHFNASFSEQDSKKIFGQEFEFEKYVDSLMDTVSFKSTEEE